VTVVELPSDEPPAVAPLEQAVPLPLADAVQLGGQAAEIAERHHASWTS
jgi:hypothetical protein